MFCPFDVLQLIKTERFFGDTKAVSNTQHSHLSPKLKSSHSNWFTGLLMLETTHQFYLFSDAAANLATSRKQSFIITWLMWVNVAEMLIPLVKKITVVPLNDYFI